MAAPRPSIGRTLPTPSRLTHSGTPSVHLGMVRADAAKKMAEAMRTSGNGN
ncbi:hypothetical protein [Streptomyces sp. 4N124]|uniref:hypothetical protein n=1 Tax=Streptomyces sp. 4N124 TaxID=3457420 RepID=UPI003FCF0533